MSPRRFRCPFVVIAHETSSETKGDRSEQILMFFERLDSCSILEVEPVCDRYRNPRRPAMSARSEPTPPNYIAGNRRRKVHPADAANAAVLAKAVRFDVALFLGTGRYARASATTIEQARIEARRLVADNPSPFCQRQPLIYGISADGYSAFAEAVQTNESAAD